MNFYLNTNFIQKFKYLFLKITFIEFSTLNDLNLRKTFKIKLILLKKIYLKKCKIIKFKIRKMYKFK